jgi:prevent-host-death family protein
MSSKSITFSEAREQLSMLIDEVRRSGRSVTITKTGQPAAVLVSCETFAEKIALPNPKPWRLRGSGAWLARIDVDEAIRKVRKSVQSSADKRFEHVIRSLSKR